MLKEDHYCVTFWNLNEAVRGSRVYPLEEQVMKTLSQYLKEVARNFQRSMLIVGGDPAYWGYQKHTHHIYEENINKIRQLCEEEGVIFTNAIRFFEAIEPFKICVPEDAAGRSTKLNPDHFHFGVTKMVSIHFTLHFCVDKWLCDFILLMNTSSLSIEYAHQHGLTNTSKGFDSQKLMAEFITNEGTTLPEDVGTEERLTTVTETLDRCPNAPAIPCNVVAETDQPFEELGAQMTAPTYSTNQAENCMVGFQNNAAFVEDTLAFQEEIAQLDMADWGNQVAEELVRDTFVGATAQVNITVDEAVRKNVPWYLCSERRTERGTQSRN